MTIGILEGVSQLKSSAGGASGSLSFAERKSDGACKPLASRINEWLL